jgi:peptidoglycan/LPS O-acetylase OafA/YrhL
VLVGALIPLGIVWNQLAHDNGWNIIATKALPAYLPYFAFGMLVALWAEWRRERGAGTLGSGLTAALVLAGFATVAADAYWHATAAPRVVNAPLAVLADIPAGLGFALVVAAAVAGGGVATRWMSVRPLAWVGLVSYGVYMWHLPLLLFARRIDLYPDAFVPRLLMLLGPVLLVAAASWYLVERPLIAWAGRPRASRAERRRAGRVDEAGAGGAERAATGGEGEAADGGRAATGGEREAGDRERAGGDPTRRPPEPQLEAHAAP